MKDAEYPPIANSNSVSKVIYRILSMPYNILWDILIRRINKKYLVTEARKWYAYSNTRHYQ